MFTFIKRRFVILLAIIGIAFLFYWFQIRPSMIRASCVKEAVSKKDYVAGQNVQYRYCLTRHGMKPESLYVK